MNAPHIGTNLDLEPSVRLFNGLDEYLNVGFGLLLLVGVAVEQIFNIHISQFSNFLIFDVLLLNIAHVVFTYFLILESPELQLWVSSTAGGHSRFWAKVTVVWIIALSAFLAIEFLLPSTAPIQKILLSLLLIFKLLIPEWHGLMQVQGLTFAYNQRANQSSSIEEKEQENVNRLVKRERRYFTVFLFTCLALNLTASHQELGLPLRDNLATWLVRGEIFLSLGVAVLIVFNSFFFPKARKSFKSLYLLRLFLFPLFSFSDLAAASTAGVHGVEYFFVYRKIKNRSKMKNSARKRMNWLSIFAGLTLVAMAFPQMIIPEKEQGLWVSILFSVATATAYAHYYLDRVMFRMRNSEVREFVGPLII